MTQNEFIKTVIEDPFSLIKDGFFYSVNNHSGDLTLQGSFSETQIPRETLKDLKYDSENCWLDVRYGGDQPIAGEKYNTVEIVLV